MVAPVPNLLGAAPPCAPPAIVTWGEMDPVKADARTYAAELAALGVPVTARRYARLPHGYGNFTTVLAGARKAMEDTGELLGKGLGAL
jgi:acetyl esterase/lipase